jgi:fluoride exporter
MARVMAWKLLLVGVGGALGAMSRYLLGQWIAARAVPDFPWGTFAINITGSLLIGFVLGLANTGRISDEARLFLAVGTLGGYTTFSTFSYEALQLLTERSYTAFLGYALGQLTVGLGATWLGLILSRIGGAR